MEQELTSTIRCPGFKAHGDSRQLIVFIHGWTGKAANFAAVKAEALHLLHDADHLIPDIRMGIFSTWRADRVVSDLLNLISRTVEEREARHGAAYDEIILVAHSFGGPIARSIWARAQGAQPTAEVDAKARTAWATRITRLVLMAGVNRGFTPNSAMSARYRVIYWLGDVFEFLFGPRLFVFDARRGSKFLTTLRLQLLELAEHQDPEKPVIVQILGTIDDVVAPGDNIDLMTGSNFYYLEAPDTSHRTVLHLKDGTGAEKRRELFRRALAGSSEAIKEKSISLSNIVDLFNESLNDFDTGKSEDLERQVKARESITHVIFVIHGIRDYGFWTKKLAARIKYEAHKQSVRCKSVTSTYGFFPMGQFLFPSPRSRKVEWLMDQYVEARALYPCAKFYYVGHSNGTFLLAEALRRCAGIKFERAVLAGSVVPIQYPWPELREGGQLGSLLNYVATEDWVVAGIPRFLQKTHLLGLGSAGHDGFNSLPHGSRQVRYVRGSHSAALSVKHWPDIANFVLNGRRVLKDTQVRPAWTNYAWVLTIVALLVAIGPIVFLLWSLGIGSLFGEAVQGPPKIPAWVAAILLISWCRLAGRVLTRI
jgi:pimeloyl-ACP methyl ester carboxylesterase